MVRFVSIPFAAALLLALGGAARAEGGQPTAIAIAVPAEAQLGQTVQVQARLTDASARPIAKRLVEFTATLAFLSGGGEVVLADARTDDKGVAIAEFEARTSGRLAIRAVFRGDDRYAAASAEAELAVAGDGQLFAQHAGVHLPGLNAGPAALPMLENGSPVVGLIEGTSALWPLLSGWPIALALMVVWSLYGSVVVLLFRIVAQAKAEAS